MRELLTHLDRTEVQTRLHKIEPGVSVSESIADELELTVFDQREASVAMARRLAMWQSGLTEPNKPIGVLFFAGPPGTGKTEMARAVSKYLFNDPNSEQLIRLDMSDYQQDHTTQKLTGSPPGYVGYNEEPALPHRIINKRNTPSVVLLDEIEKAHPAVLKQLLSAFDKGELSARNGRDGFETLDFSRTLFIMTSNIASEQVVAIEKTGHQRIGFVRDTTATRDDEIQRVVKEAMKAKFPPEFLDRVDQFVRFMPLESEATRRSILLKFVGEQNAQFQERWAGEAPYLALTREAQDVLLSNKDDKGGRGIKRELHQRVVSQLPDVMMGMDFKRRPFVADIEDGKTVWYTDVRDPEQEERPAVLVKRQKNGDLRITKLPDPDMNGNFVPEGGKKNEPPMDDDRFDAVGGRDVPKEPPQEDWGVGEDEETHGGCTKHPLCREMNEKRNNHDDLGDMGDMPPQDDEERNENIKFFMPNTGDIWPTISLAITIKERGRPDKMQLIENLPLTEGDR